MSVVVINKKTQNPKIMKGHDPLRSKQYIVSSKIMQLKQRLSLIPSEGQRLSRDTSAIILPYTKQLLVGRM